MTTIYKLLLFKCLDMFDNMYPNICLSHCKFSDMFALGNHLLTYNITDDQLVSGNSCPINVQFCQIFYGLPQRSFFMQITEGQ